MRAFVGVLAALLLVGVLFGTGAAIYNQGVSAGLAAAGEQPSGDGDEADPRVGSGVAPYIKGGIGFGVGSLVGLLFSILLIVIIVGLARVAFSGRGPGGGPHSGGWGSRQERMDEWHRELHRREANGGTQHPAGA
jgi:hypothetical protein